MKHYKLKETDRSWEFSDYSFNLLHKEDWTYNHYTQDTTTEDEILDLDDFYENLIKPYILEGELLQILTGFKLERK